MMHFQIAPFTASLAAAIDVSTSVIVALPNRPPHRGGDMAAAAVSFLQSPRRRNGHRCAKRPCAHDPLEIRRLATKSRRDKYLGGCCCREPRGIASARAAVSRCTRRRASGLSNGRAHIWLRNPRCRSSGTVAQIRCHTMRTAKSRQISRCDHRCTSCGRWQCYRSWRRPAPTCARPKSRARHASLSITCTRQDRPKRRCVGNTTSTATKRKHL